jgi:hypothetical protein
MPVDNAKAMQVWARYAYARDNGHTAFMQKADLCERFFAGDQWEKADLELLRQQRRPALTINKIISTLSNVMGEQIYQRAEISFRPRNGAPPSLAETMTKVFKQISDNNQLDWKRSDMFADGAITSRGYLDARIAFDDSMQGEVRITALNPKNVIPDPDGEQMDPDTWNECFVTKWFTADDIACLYGKEDAELLRGRQASGLPYGYDSIDDIYRGRFGTAASAYSGSYDESNVRRCIRVIERQYRKLDRQQHFVSMDGDMRQIPSNFDRDRIAFFCDKFGFQVIPKLVSRIRWCVVADDVILHDEWSPYKHFTVIPYFPYFRHGKTIGLVENLIGPQELLNKTSSQELHVVNTTANSGWKIKTGTLANMSTEELEQRGAESGIVLETSGDPEKDIVKILPNAIPTGLERISYKAEEHIKTISGVSDSMQGFDREDVAAKAIQAKRQAGSTNLVKPLDSLTRSDFVFARNVIDLVQGFYTERRVMTITKDHLTGESEEFVINDVNEQGNVIDDLTMGEYDIVVSSVPVRETIEDSQFEQAMNMRKEGVQLPDEIVIENSRLLKKREIVKKMREAAQSPMAQARERLSLRGAQAEVMKTEAEAENKTADTQLKLTKAKQTDIEADKNAATPIEQDDGAAGAAQLMKTEADIELNERRFAHEQQLDYAKLNEEKRTNDVDAALKQQDLEEKREDQRIAQAQAAAQAAQQPTTPKGA